MNYVEYGRENNDVIILLHGGVLYTFFLICIMESFQ